MSIRRAFYGLIDSIMCVLALTRSCTLADCRLYSRSCPNKSMAAKCLHDFCFLGYVDTCNLHAPTQNRRLEHTSRYCRVIFYPDCIFFNNIFRNALMNSNIFCCFPREWKIVEWIQHKLFSVPFSEMMSGGRLWCKYGFQKQNVVFEHLS